MKLSTRFYILLTFLVALWCAGILAAPLLRHAGYLQVSSRMYSLYSRICHQDDARCFHMEGEKFGVCTRCSAIYFSFLAGLLTLPAAGLLRRQKAPERLVLVLTTVPMALDAVLNVLGVHASTTTTRIVTGVLFGAVVPWYVVPPFLDACQKLVQRNPITHHSPES